MTQLTLKPPSSYQLRQELHDLIMTELHGPSGGEEEELTEPVRDRYLVGLLAPGKLQDSPEPEGHFDPGEEEDLNSAETTRSAEDGTADAVSQQIFNLTPSSFGLSFCVSAEVSNLKITASWGHYQRERSETLTTPDGAPRLVWKRMQRCGVTTIPLRQGPVRDWRPVSLDQPEVVVRGLVRKMPDSSAWSITLFLVNQQREPEKNRDSAWLFQPELIVEAPDLSPVFVRRLPQRPGLPNPDREEELVMEMLYRNQVAFAVGHGVGVHAEIATGDPTRAYRLTTRVVPSYEVPRTDHLTPADNPDLNGLELKMKALAATPAAELPARLNPLISAYQKWIERQAARLSDHAERLEQYRKVAGQNLQNARNTLARIQAGIELLVENPEAYKAFCFMNEAMHRQFVQSRLAEQKRQGKKPDPSAVADPAWRPFQLAFILLNLPALTDLEHHDRSEDAGAVADLLWFPTGGGKTEAYLGLTAYTLAIRRLQGTVNGRKGDEGIAVIMRYTLRLLTLQQFQRATALICACEVIRREAFQKGDAGWGNTPFRLGLWVGQRATPNTTQQSEEAIKQEGGRGSTLGGSGTPRQLTNCPWCGDKLKTPVVETFSKGRGRTLVFCKDSYGDCPFTEKQAPREGLPVLVVDEEIYRLLPGLLIATVDKFAQMPWKGATQMLFGQVDKKCERHGFCPPDFEESTFHPARYDFPSAKVVAHPPLRPPDLIIQDELHLISGPLGTLVGLYETAVDYLSSWQVNGKTIRPKVIAATATIRRAERQVHSVFLRKVNIFPPSGLDIGDNFFARQIVPAEESPGRLYLGICANGRRLKAALIRVYVACLAAGEQLYRKYGAAADPWLTLVGYFNSLNDLGGTRRLVEDDVRSRLQQMDKRGFPSRKIGTPEELTSRRSSIDIPRILDRLEKSFDPSLQKKDNWDNQPLDVLLATNMISVGVDVQRLGLMVVTSQPKNTAEYIQATSRVGRKYPGLVLVVYNWARPRDLSHYEQFEHYHATYYQYVEALSVTPFAARAIDRGLSALLVSFVRLSGQEYNENSKAGLFTLDNTYFNLALEKISARAELVKKEPAIRKAVKNRLEELGKRWVSAADLKLAYKDDSGTVVGLLEQPGRGGWADFTCLNSLRDVEPTVKLILDNRSMGQKDISPGLETGTPNPSDETEVTEGGVADGQ